MKTLVRLLLFASLSLVGSARAEEPSVTGIVEALQPSAGGTAAPGGKGGGLVRGLTVEAGDAKPSINMHIEFPYNSSALDVSALITLRRLAAALNDPKLKGYKFQVAGYTDASGSDAYNLRLSQDRAHMVEEVLVNIFDVGSDRLTSTGFGKANLLDPSHPKDAINRRVQITNEGDATAAAN